MGARLARMAGRAGREDKGPNRGSCGRGHRWLVSERTAFRTTVSQARIPTWMGLPARKRSLWSSENGVTYASIPRRNAKTAASQRPPGTGKGRLIDSVLQIYWIFDKEAPSGMAVAPNFRTPLTNVTGRSRCRRINVAVIGVDLVV